MHVYRHRAPTRVSIAAAGVGMPRLFYYLYDFLFCIFLAGTDALQNGQPPRSCLTQGWSPSKRSPFSVEAKLAAIDPGFSLDFSSETMNPPVLAFAALTLGVLANGWIQTMISGDQGLGNFLSDGSGFGKSKFRPVSSSDVERSKGSSDPLPWLRLPQLDFVEVAGQTKEDPVLVRLEQMRIQLSEQLKEGDEEGAKETREEMERLMIDNGISFVQDD